MPVRERRPVFQMCNSTSNELPQGGWIFPHETDLYLWSALTIPVVDGEYPEELEYYIPGEINKEYTDFVLKSIDNKLSVFIEEYDMTVRFIPRNAPPLPYVGKYKDFVEPYTKFALLVPDTTLMDWLYKKAGILIVGLTPVFGNKR
jgi:hypothetical protein